MAITSKEIRRSVRDSASADSKFASAKRATSLGNWWGRVAGRKEESPPGVGLLVEISDGHDPPVPSNFSPSRCFPGNNFCDLCCCPQTKAGRGEDPRGKDTGLLGEAQEGGSGAACHVSHMPENQVRRRRRPHLQLLQHPVLRTLRRKGQSTVEQGRGEIRKRSGKIYRTGGNVAPSNSLCFFFFAVLALNPRLVMRSNGN